MSTYTPYLDLLKKNPATEGTDTFNITTMLNDNWDKIDSGLATRAIRPNLLDNAYFVGGGSQQNGGQFPINQRGETTYKRTTEYLGYCIDRWIQRDNNRNGQGITLQSDGLAINFSGNGIQGISQAIEDPSKLLGKTVTFSVLFGSRTGRMWIGLWWSATAGLQTTSIRTLEVSSALPSVTVTLPASIPSGSSYLNVSIMTYAGNTPTAKILAAKLELGGTQTLAHQESGVWVLNDIPNYLQELERCQRFYYNAIKIPVNGYGKCGLAIATSTSALTMVLPLPVSMRTTPTLTYKGEWRICGGSSYSFYDVTNIALAQASEQSGGNLAAINLTATGANLTTGQPYMLQVSADTTADICLSADL